MEPLVSLGIITYNSSKFIIEALESMKSQTYNNVELIISDDCSSDDTVDVCRRWLEDNGKRFVNTQIIVPQHNTGTAGNCNRLMRACRGEWVKYIAGDDKLHPNCVENFMNYIKSKPSAEIIFSNVIGFGNMDAAKKWPFSNPGKIFNNMSYEEIRMCLFKGNFLPAPSTFIKKSCWKKLGGYEESIPLLEDWPFWIKAFQANCNIQYMNKVTAYYRFSESSISQKEARKTNSNNIIKSKFQESSDKAKKFAELAMKRDSIGGLIFYYTTSGIKYGSFRWKFIHYWNIFNPFRKKYIKSLTKLRSIINK